MIKKEESINKFKELLKPSLEVIYRKSIIGRPNSLSLDDTLTAILLCFD